jgi:cathepsin L
LAGVATAFTPQEYAETFEKWAQEHGKVYSREDFNYRFRVFKQSMDFVAEHNAGDHSFTVELNHFADLTPTEFLERYTGFHSIGERRPAPGGIHDDEDVGDISGKIVDWRSKGAVTGVKDQGQCGSCWSFSATGAIEGMWKLHNGTLVSLSEQNLMDCSRRYGNLGCNGGLMDSAFDYVIANKGIDTEKFYPYEGTCDFNCRYNANYNAAQVRSYVDVKSQSEPSLQTAVDKQPVSVAIDASKRSFSLYSGNGIYYESTCSSTRLDHGVLCVGYGSNSEGDYWIVKNSWGTGWGDQGYIYMARNKGNNCGIATQASYPTV